VERLTRPRAESGLETPDKLLDRRGSHAKPRAPRRKTPEFEDRAKTSISPDRFTSIGATVDFIFTNDVTGQSLLHDEGGRPSECDRRSPSPRMEPTRYWLGDGFCGQKCRLIKEMIMNFACCLITVD